jgi:hypothetical protein
MLDQIFDGMKVQIEHEKARRLDRECEARQKAVAEKVRREKQQLWDVEERRRKELLGDAARWQQAQEIRTYITAIREAAEAGKMRITSQTDFSNYLEWATGFANHLDPLIRAKQRWQTAHPAINTPVSQVDLTSRAKPVLAKLGVTDTDSLFKVPEDQIQAHCWGLWNEVCRVLEGLGYNMAGRKYWL